MGLVNCNSSDATQRWILDPKTAQLMNNPKNDLNSGPVCKGDAGNSMLLYPAQGHLNEKYSHNSTTGAIKQSHRCLVVTAVTPSPPPPPISRTITVSWEQLGWDMDSKVSVRDLWAKRDLGVQSQRFSASVREHQALIYVMTPTAAAAAAAAAAD